MTNYWKQPKQKQGTSHSRLRTISKSVEDCPGKHGVTSKMLECGAYWSKSCSSYCWVSWPWNDQKDQARVVVYANSIVQFNSWWYLCNWCSFVTCVTWMHRRVFFVGLGINVFPGLCLHYFCVPCCVCWYEHSLKSIKPFESWERKNICARKTPYALHPVFR